MQKEEILFNGHFRNHPQMYTEAFVYPSPSPFSSHTALLSHMLLHSLSSPVLFHDIEEGRYCVD